MFSSYIYYKKNKKKKRVISLTKRFVILQFCHFSH
ncbi:hypothetical protein BCE_4529 [Bacillus cereus ATCC 10987]|uniref:Uncharacterized protein n=1 Tax=Bacillus cereus (strain ATCC 10987 / NRS 248) TaxID=222523 RepID=Q72ZY8_BACC1|nr:hypothetical protein BCE_4529 [Bacillus cereus ATCC 10987]